jgi:hypothetical protein
MSPLPSNFSVLARPVDRAGDDLRRHVAGSAEELGALVGLLEGLHPRIRRVHREERVVHVRPEAREERIEETVGSHQLDVVPAQALHLLTEGLALRRQLPGEVHELRVARDLVDDRGEVRLLLADAVARDADALRLQLSLDLVGEADAVGLLVVDDVDALQLQLADDVAGHGLALSGVRRDGPEEVALPGPVGRDRRVRRRAGDEAETCALEGTRRGLDLIGAGRADNAEDARVRGERLRALDRLGRSVRGAELRVLVDELDLRLVRPVVLVLVEVGPVDLVDADRCGGAGKRRHQADRAGLAALDERRAGTRRCGRPTWRFG